jgi:hypothetical protein
VRPVGSECYAMMMWMTALGFDASAHPPMAERLADDAHERLVEDVLSGPTGCWQSDGVVRWDHRSGGFETRGEARTRWRFDHRVWRVDEWALAEADRDSLDVVVAPMLLGTAIHVDLVWPLTGNRRMEWPQPVATLPTRLWGEVTTLAVDELDDGGRRVVESFSWDGWKRVDGERAVVFVGAMSPRSAWIDTTDRWRNGCRVRSVGEAELGVLGLPSSETWRFDGRCTLQRWTGVWTFEFTEWRRCAFSGPSEPSDL